MNAQFFSTKRAHHGILRIAREPLARFVFTPARFDMLYAIGRRRETLQSSLRRALGVTAPVVSRMLRSLEELRLVKRERGSADRRQRILHLTDAGRCCLRHAVRKVARPHRAPYRSLMRAITFGHPGNVDMCFRATCNLDSLLVAMRREFGDSATLHYPWHPDD
jgi:DNA-binding MarR family transcriptional regulator